MSAAAADRSGTERILGLGKSYRVLYMQDVGPPGPSCADGSWAAGLLASRLDA